MLLGIFAVYDTGISTWMAPMYMRNKGEALRWWQEIANNPESKVAKHPGDYTLFELGSWNDDKCEFILHKAPIKLGTAIEYLKAPAGGVGGLGASPQERSEATGASSGGTNEVRGK